MTDETVTDPVPADTTQKRRRKAEPGPSAPMDDVSPDYAPNVVPGARVELPSGLVIESF